MINIAFTFLVLAFIAGTLGFTGVVAVATAEAAKLMCASFLLMFFFAVGIQFFSRRMRPLA